MRRSLSGVIVSPYWNREERQAKDGLSHVGSPSSPERARISPFPHSPPVVHGLLGGAGEKGRIPAPGESHEHAPHVAEDAEEAVVLGGERGVHCSQPSRRTMSAKMRRRSSISRGSSRLSRSSEKSSTVK